MPMLANPQGSKYTDDDRRQAIVEYSIAGSIPKVAHG